MAVARLCLRDHGVPTPRSSRRLGQEHALRNAQVHVHVVCSPNTLRFYGGWLSSLPAIYTHTMGYMDMGSYRSSYSKVFVAMLTASVARSTDDRLETRNCIPRVTSILYVPRDVLLRECRSLSVEMESWTLCVYIG